MSAIDYDLSKIRGIAFDVDGVLSPSTIPLSAEGEPLRMVNIKDGFALQLAVKKGLKIAIITGGNTKAVNVRFTKLGITDIYQGVSVKEPVLRQWMADNGMSPEEVAFMGDDIPDMKAMHAAGLSCAPADAAWEIRAMAKYVSPNNGGYGCARDLISQVMGAKGIWLEDAESFGW